MRSGERVSGLEVVVTDRVTAIAGVITDGENTPLSERTAIIFHSDVTKWSDESRYMRVARSDLKGQFAVRALPPGDYLAVAIDHLDEGNWTNPEYLRPLRRVATHVSLEVGASQALSLRLVDR
jgi:hypothetical protein